jgi:acyl-CoA reductase-like NAD-dependent aldehyde dehydrogenase
LELGGSNPGIIFPDTNIDDNLMADLFFKRFNNNGQVCDAVKRLIVHRSIFDLLIKAFTDYVRENSKLGDPEDKKTNLGSLVAKRQLELLENQVKDAVQKGAKVVIGGRRPKGLPGAYYQPTILTGIRRNMRVWQEEVFGPVLPVTFFNTEEEAVKLANDTQYGLGAVVYSRDMKRARRVASQIQAGCININDGNHWQPYNPFGGYNFSGIGREHGRHGFQELCQIKVVSSGW